MYWFIKITSSWPILDCRKGLKSHPIFNQNYLTQSLILTQRDSINGKDMYWIKRVMFTVSVYYYGRYQVVILHFIQRSHMILVWPWKSHKVLEKNRFLIPLMVTPNFISVNILSIDYFRLLIFFIVDF